MKGDARGGGGEKGEREGEREAGGRRLSCIRVNENDDKKEYESKG